MVPGPPLRAQAEQSTNALSPKSFLHDKSTDQSVGLRLQVPLHRYLDPAGNLILEACDKCGLIRESLQTLDPLAYRDSERL